MWNLAAVSAHFSGLASISLGKVNQYQYFVFKLGEFDPQLCTAAQEETMLTVLTFEESKMDGAVIAVLPRSF